MNGHKYIINDTITTRNTAFGQSVFKVRTVDIQPLDDDDTATATADSAGEAAAKKPVATTEAALTTAEPAAAATAADNDDSKKTEADEIVDRGSPEVLDIDHSRNEIGHRSRSDRIEVMHI